MEKPRLTQHIAASPRQNQERSPNLVVDSAGLARETSAERVSAHSGEMQAYLHDLQRAANDPRLQPLDVRIFIFARGGPDGGLWQRGDLAKLTHCCNCAVPKAMKRLVKFGYVTDWPLGPVKPAVMTARRAKIFAKTNGACFYCKKTYAPETMHIDHMTPIARGGSDRMSNLIAACRSCNFKKRAMTAEEFRAVQQ